MHAKITAAISLSLRFNVEYVFTRLDEYICQVSLCLLSETTILIIHISEYVENVLSALH